MSNINTNNIDASYPIPGVNNNSQGFRDNFAGTKQNLGIAAQEITELQQKAVLKSAISGQTLNNDLQGTAISNATVQGFRTSIASIQQGDISGASVTVSANRADIQVLDIGNLNFANSSTVDIQFRRWSAPSGTQGNIQLVILGAANTKIGFANSNVDSSRYQLENYDSITDTIVAGADISTGQAQTPLVLNFSTNDCGNSITVTPANRSRRASQVSYRTPSFIGQPGDGIGSVSVDENNLWICTRNYDGINQIWQTVSAGAGSAGNTITNGSSNVAVAANGNVTTAVAGTTVLNIGNTATSLTGNLSVSGSITANTRITAANATITGTATIATLSITGTATVNTLSVSNTINGNSLSITGNGNIGTVNATVLSVANGATISNSLSSDGNVAFTGASVNLGSVSNLSISGGTANQFLRTDGAGNLSWASGGAANASSIDNGTSNVVVSLDANVTMGVAGTANVLVVSPTTVDVTGNLTVSANIQANNISSAQTISAVEMETEFSNVSNTISTGNIIVTASTDVTNLLVTGTFRAPTSTLSVGGVAAEGDISTRGNLSAANLTISGTFNTPAFSVTNTLTAGRIVANSASLGGNTDLVILRVANSIVANTLTVNNSIISSGTVNFTGSPNISLGTVGNLRINGGANGQVLTTNGSGILTWTTPAGGGGGNSTAIVNGNSNVSIATANGIVTISVGGVNNILAANTDGIAVRGNVSTSSGGISSSGNISTSANIYANTGSIITGSLGVTSNIAANTAAFTGAITAASANVNGNILVGNISANGEISGNSLTSNLATLGNIIANAITVANIVTTGTATVTIQSNANLTLRSGGSGSVVVSGGTGNIIVTNAVNANTLNANAVSVTGNITTPNISVTTTASLTAAAIATAGITTANITTANVSTLIVTGTSTVGSLSAGEINSSANIIGSLRTTSTPPVANNSPGVAGQIAIGSVSGNYYLYVCVATNTWRQKLLDNF